MWLQEIRDTFRLSEYTKMLFGYYAPDGLKFESLSSLFSFIFLSLNIKSDKFSKNVWKQ